MMGVTPIVIRHMSTGRLRIAVSGETKHRRSVGALAEALGQYPRVLRASPNAKTGSVLVLHEGSADEILALAERQKLISVVKSPPVSVRRGVPSTRLADGIAAGMRSFDQTLMASSGGNVDLPSLTAVALFGAAAWRAGTGAMLPSAVSLASIALRLLGARPR